MLNDKFKGITQASSTFQTVNPIVQTVRAIVPRLKQALLKIIRLVLSMHDHNTVFALPFGVSYSYVKASKQTFDAVI